jgi:microcystin-dependent protein
MTTPFLGEISMFGGNFAIRGWAFCNGQVLPISQNTALFSLLGVTYGGNGTSSFALPNLQATTPMHWGQGIGLSPYVLGQTAGVTSVTVSNSTMLGHNHAVVTSTAGQASDQSGVPGGTVVLGDSDPGKAYAATATPVASFSPLAIGSAGGSSGGAAPHANQQPYLAVSFMMAMQGVFPTRN